MQGNVADSTKRSKWAFGYAIDGDLKFISHHDTLRLFRRAFARAVLPVRYSEGFNPHPRMTIPLPRPVGIASEDEVLVVEFSDLIDPEDALSRLRRCVPDGMTMRTLRELASGEKLVPDKVRYRFSFGTETPFGLRDRASELMETPELMVTRQDPKGGRSTKIDVRPFLMGLTLVDDAVEFLLRVTGTGTARPSEIVHLLGFEERQVNHRIQRMEVQWQ